MDSSQIVGRGPQVGLVVASASRAGDLHSFAVGATWLDQGIITGLVDRHPVLCLRRRPGRDRHRRHAAGENRLPFPESWSIEQRRRVAIAAARRRRRSGRFRVGGVCSGSATTTIRCVLWSGRSDCGWASPAPAAPCWPAPLPRTEAIDDRLSAGGRIARFPVATTGRPGDVGHRRPSAAGARTRRSMVIDSAAAQSAGGLGRGYGHRADAPGVPRRRGGSPAGSVRSVAGRCPARRCSGDWPATGRCCRPSGSGPMPCGVERCVASKRARRRFDEVSGRVGGGHVDQPDDQRRPGQPRAVGHHGPRGSSTRDRAMSVRRRPPIGPPRSADESGRTCRSAP